MAYHSAHTLQDPQAQQAEDADFYRHVLQDLIIMGKDIASLVHTQAVADAMAVQQGRGEPGPPPDQTIPFDRISRAVRRCIILAREVAQPMPLPRDPARHRAATRQRIQREVEDAIHHAAPDRPDAETLAAELRDRQDAPDLDDDLANRSVAAIIAEICRDLGLASPPSNGPWKPGTQAGIARPCAAASRPCQPGTAPDHGQAATQPSPTTNLPANPQPSGPTIPCADQPTPIHMATRPTTPPGSPRRSCTLQPATATNGARRPAPKRNLGILPGEPPSRPATRPGPAGYGVCGGP